MLVKMLTDIGHAGQPGYVARKGEIVVAITAHNLPTPGYFIINRGEIFVKVSEAAETFEPLQPEPVMILVLIG